MITAIAEGFAVQLVFQNIQLMGLNVGIIPQY
jgi:hypothetical protein